MESEVSFSADGVPFECWRLTESYVNLADPFAGRYLCLHLSAALVFSIRDRQLRKTAESLRE